MAELNVGELQMTITADGSAAIQEIDRVSQAADKAAQSAKSAGTSGQSAGAQAAGGARQASGAYQEAGRAAQSAGSSAAKAAQESREAWSKTAETLTNIGSTMSKMITLPVVGAMTAAVAGASDLTETLGKTEVVFDSMSDRVLKWSESSVQSMGLAQGSALEFASTYGDMATGMGLTIDKAAQMSMNLTQLAADMASFKNISTEVAAQKLNAIFTGETEGLKSLGIVMNQTNLQAFALSQGITKSMNAMTQQEMVMLRYQYVMNATKNAQGDFARTGDSFANQTRKLGETVKQVGEAFGNLLLPMITPIVEKIQQFAQHIAELDTGTKNMILSIAAVAAAIGPLLLVGGKLITFISTLKVALAGLALNPVVMAMIGLAAAVAGVVALKRELDRANGSVENADASYQKFKDTVEGGASGDVTIDANTEDAEMKIAGLTKDLPEGEVTIKGNTDPVMQDCVDIVTTLQKPQYYGKLTIDGDPNKATTVLSEVQGTINQASAAMTINGNGDPVIGDKGLLPKIQKAIEELEGVVVITDNNGEAQALCDMIIALQTNLQELKGSVVITEDGKTLADLEEERADLQGKLKELKGELTISQSGKTLNELESERATLQQNLDNLKGELKLTDDPKEIKRIQGEINDTQEALDKLDKEMSLGFKTDHIASVEEEISAIQGKLDALDAIIDVSLGNAPTDDELQKQREELQGKLTDLEMKLKVTPAGTEEYDTTLQQINDLKDAIGLIDQAIEIQATFKAEEEANLDAYLEKLDSLGAKETYTTTGKFVYTPETAKLIDDYTKALGDAALATDNYKDAVENLDKATDARYADKIQQVKDQATEKAQAIWREYNSAKGTENEFSEDEAIERIKQVGEDALKEIQTLEAQQKAEKKANEIYKDGDRQNDFEAWAKMQKDIVGDTGATQLDMLNSERRAATAVKEGNTGDVEAQKAAQAAYNKELANSKQQLTDLQAAYETYQAEISAADAELEGSQTSYEQQTAAIETMQGALKTYMGVLAGGTSEETALDEVMNLDTVKGMSESMQNYFRSMLTDSEGQALKLEDTGEAQAQLESFSQQAEASLEGAKQKAKEAKETALTNLTDAVNTAADLQGKTSSELETALDINSKLGVSMSQASQTAITQGQQVMTDLANTLNNPDAASKIDIDGTLTNAIGDLSGLQSALSTAVEGIDTKAMGEDLIAGVGEGEASADTSGAANTAISNVEKSMRTAAISSSPAVRFMPLGNDISAGVGEGMIGYSFASAASQVISAITSSFGTLKSDATEIGKYASEGVANGITQNAHKALSAARTLANQIQQIMKKAFEINSPSKVMRDQVGKMIPAGIAVGMEEGTPSALETIRRSTSKLISGATDVVNRGSFSTPAFAGAALPGIDYGAMAGAMTRAMDRVKFGFRVGDVELARATRDASSQQIALRANQINRGYGGK